MFDSEHGHQLLNYGYPDESDEMMRDVRRHEFFTLRGDALKEGASAKFQESGSLFLDDSNLPDLITKTDDLVTLEDGDVWDCQGVDVEKALVCETKLLEDDPEESCNFELPQEFY